ncbi:MAG: hypothetical protein Q8R88_17880, partial [Desulfoprunum sp.]|nr:hypothetical protein [Desulfoprunum sp.]
MKDVLEIFAFKRDLGTVDLICIGFRVDSDGSFNEIDEEMKGYKTALEELPDYFNGINTEWFSDVAFPAF